MRLWREREVEDDPYTTRRERKAPTRAAFVRELRSHHRYYLIVVGNRAVGSLTLAKDGDIGVCLFPRERSRGYGAKAVRLLLKRERPAKGGSFRARIHPQNFRSIRLFESLGFRHTFNIYTRKP